MSLILCSSLPSIPSNCVMVDWSWGGVSEGWPSVVLEPAYIISSQDCILCSLWPNKISKKFTKRPQTCKILTFNSKPFFSRFNKFEENSVKLDGTKEKLWDIQEFENFRVKHTKTYEWLWQTHLLGIDVWNCIGILSGNYHQKLYMYMFIHVLVCI